MCEYFWKNALSIRLIENTVLQDRLYVRVFPKKFFMHTASIENTALHDWLYVWLLLKKCFAYTASIENTALNDCLYAWLFRKEWFKHTASIKNTALHLWDKCFGQYRKYGFPWSLEYVISFEKLL